MRGAKSSRPGWTRRTPIFPRSPRRGGKMIVAIGTNDTLASPGAQLDYYQSVIDKMGRPAVDEFARFYVIPQTGHGLTGSSYTANGDGQTIPATQIPSRFDRVAMLLDWVEKGTPPPKSATVTGSAGSLPVVLVSHLSEIQLRPAHRSGVLHVRRTLGIGDGMKTATHPFDCYRRSLPGYPAGPGDRSERKGARASKFMELRYGGGYSES